MTRQTMEEDIGNSISQLTRLAAVLTFNTYADEKLFILSEIKNTDPHGVESFKTIYKQNDRKIPKSLSAQLRRLQQLFDNLYDINIYIHKATTLITIIDIRYYAQSSLDRAYRKTVVDHSPMLHCKIALPPDYEKGVKFDIHWPNRHKIV
ncbi:MAG TPA: hypothetical protein VK616_02740 [Flavitalea sp.]|nr:hypothetical protein [Flavitalea sp.]HTF31867.1 hypothetical protein [Flavitalea sp.]